jgi:hypothetical protein
MQAMLPSQGHYDSLRSRIEPNSQRNLTYAMSYEDGKESAVSEKERKKDIYYRVRQS